MKIADWLNASIKLLNEANIETARLDCLVLISDELGVDKSYVLSHPETILSAQQIRNLNKNITQRSNHFPLAYIRGHSEFYGRSFVVNESVLVPRPESETIIELLKTLPKSETIIDVGTGSGALAITAKLEVPISNVVAIDISPDCLKIAAKNAEILNANVNFIESNLLDNIYTGTLNKSIVVANLPYVPNEMELNTAAKKEPRLAIFGGQDGLDLYRQLFKTIHSNKPGKPSFVITESLPFQHKQLAILAKNNGLELIKTDGYVQVFSSLEQPQV